MNDFFGRRLAIIQQRLRRDPARPPRVWMRKQWPWLAAMGLAVLGVLYLDAWLVSCGFAGCPSRGEIRSFRPPEGGRILDRNGRLIGRLQWVRRVNVPLEQVPAHVRQAFVAVEDRDFYEHRGIAWRSFARALVRNVSAGGVREGFSTITMQVARNTFAAGKFGNRTMPKKLMELRLSRLLERELTKDQILETYLNVIYLGNGVYGVEAASRDLFGKSVNKLSLSEAALLAALPKGPSAYTPRRHPDRARQRRDLVLAIMAREGYVSEQRAKQSQQVPVRVAEEEWRPSRSDDSYAFDAVRAVVDSVLESKSLELGDLTVYTTLDGPAQRAAESAVKRRAAAIQREAWGRDKVQGAMVAIDPANGDIRALVGGSEYERKGFNRALAARRQPGSAFKPFVYAAALQAGLSSATYVDDEPVEITEGRRVWTPANYGDEYLGRVTFRRALMKSANAATVRVSRSVGERRVVELANRAGIVSKLDPVPSIALGALEVTPLELVTAYAPFANGGRRVTPRLVRRIEAADGTPVWSSEVGETSAVLDSKDAYELTSMLRTVVDHGTGRSVRDYGVSSSIPVAGKTGTTNNGADVWFVGYTPSIVAGFWFGFDQPKQISGDASGGRLAAPAWAEFYKAGWKEKQGAAWAPPDGMVAATIDPTTGELATEWCPLSRREWFEPGGEPTSECQGHAAPPEPEYDEWGFPKGDDNDVGTRIGRALKKIFQF